MPATARPLVMGVVNVTPDSFSDGGRYASTDAAVRHGLRLLEDGADLLDIGGESTRPGATRPLVSEELDRVVPVITELAAAGARVSVDTMRAEVASAALAAGAQVVNDVSGGLADPRILAVVADSAATYVAMHWRAHSDRMRDLAVYDGPGGVVAAVREELAERVAAVLGAGVPRERLVLDPGLGFAKRGEHNWQLLRDLDQVAVDGLPLLVGASRKSFLGSLLAGADGVARPVDEREDAGHALSVLLAARGVWGLRVHDVRGTRDALAVWERLGMPAVPDPLPALPTEPPGTLDELAVTGIECWAHHGVLEHERRDGQLFSVDLVLGLDTRAAAASDDLHQTVDYGSLGAAVHAAVQTDPVDLIETVAQRIADICLARGGVQWARVTVHKPDAPLEVTFTDVAVTITRRREGR